MNIEHKCAVCKHSAADPVAPVEARLLGKTPRICMRFPPSAIAIHTPQGVAMASAYPIVTSESMSCGEFSMDNSEG